MNSATRPLKSTKVVLPKEHGKTMDLTAWIVTLAGLVAIAWVVWYFWIYDEPVD